MKIGIITFIDTQNYGALLQAYALNKKLTMMGYDSIVVYYRFNANKSDKYVSPKLSLKSLHSPKSIINYLLDSSIEKHSRKRFDSTKKFLSGNIPLTPICYNSQEIDDLGLDVHICGSDQIWNPNITKGLKIAFFGGNSQCRKIAYAASGPEAKAIDQYRESFANLASNMDYVSVRERELQEYVGSLSIDAQVVIDPTLLLTKDSYTSITTKKANQKPYLLVYSLRRDKPLLSYAKKMAKEKQLELIEIYAEKRLLCRHKQVFDASPDEFLGYIDQAQYVVTNSFHGTVFSILFKKQFSTFASNSRSSRIINLLTNVSLIDRLNPQSLIAGKTVIDYSKVDFLLDELRKSSTAFLTNSLSEDNYHPKERKTYFEDANRTRCFGCWACENICTKKAITMQEDSMGFRYPVKDLTKCNNCGLCARICPHNKPIMQHEQFTQERWAIKVKDDEIRAKSSSGGAFSVFASTVLERGGVVYGAGFSDEEFTVSHQRVDKIEELDTLRRSKYVQSDVNDIYTRVKEDLKSGIEVMFTGTPCQIAGLKGYLIKDYDNLFLVEILCFGVPSQKVFKRFKEYVQTKHKQQIITINFRDKIKGWHDSKMSITFESGKRLIVSDVVIRAYTALFYSRNNIRPSCGSCMFTQKARNADVSMADYWHIEKFAPDFDDNKGISQVIISTIKGKKLFNDASPKFDYIAGDTKIGVQKTTTEPRSLNANALKFEADFADKDFGYILNKYARIKFLRFYKVAGPTLVFIKKLLGKKIK